MINKKADQMGGLCFQRLTAVRAQLIIDGICNKHSSACQQHSIEDHYNSVEVVSQKRVFLLHTGEPQMMLYSKYNGTFSTCQ